MKFCRNCGTPIATGPLPPTPQFATPPPVQYPPAMAAPSAPYNAAPPIPSVAAYSATPPPSSPGLAPPGMPPAVMGVSAPVPALAPSAGPVPACPRCSAPASPGHVFCQRCGFQLGSMPATAPGTGVVPPVGPSGPVAGPGAAKVDPIAATLAHSSSQPNKSQSPWGTAVLVNRDGTDGDRFTLSGEYVVIGRNGGDIQFEQDRFLARQHARLEMVAGALRIVPLDAVNGAFRRVEGKQELVDGTIALVGRELLRFELVDQRERAAEPLIRHGVALFGSPPRDPWGRLIQLLPNGGVRDIRHLSGEEVIVGREDGDLVFRDDAFMSRRHASLQWDGQRAFLVDLGSSNGTFIRLTGTTTLRFGDHIRLGDQLFRLEAPR